jgi:hypothetical protein
VIIKVENALNEASDEMRAKKKNFRKQMEDIFIEENVLLFKDLIKIIENIRKEILKNVLILIITLYIEYEAIQDNSILSNLND